MKVADYFATVEVRVAGIPCLAGVLHYNRVEGSFSHNAPSDLDYYGYTECDYDILDMRGRRAAWLEKKLTDDDRAAIERAIAEAMQ